MQKHGGTTLEADPHVPGPRPRRSAFPVAGDVCRRLAFGICCVSSVARGDAPRIGGHVALGARVSTREAPYEGTDDTASARVAAEGLVGVRFGRTVVGLHAGVATPLSFFQSPTLGYCAETGASTTSTIWPFDVGLGGQLDAGAGFWISAWLGATVALTRASSPAAQVNAIDYYGDIPAASWSERTTSLGYGVGAGYNIGAEEYGGLAAFVTVDSQGIGKIPTRSNSGQIGSDPQTGGLRSLSVTVGVAYQY